MAVFWYTAPCSVALMMEAVRTSETLHYFYQIIRRYTPEGIINVVTICEQMAVFCHLKVENKLLAYYVICSI